MVNISAGLEQPLAVAITDIVAVIGLLVVLVAVNEGILPMPFAGSPIAVFEFVHVYVVAETALLKVVIGVITPLQ